ncbi:MAG: hypothetical protein JNK82_03565, partial [Myxococcaceae bacterium]|nr:hypothetical protein [Myxococcaceae bacterium]
MPPQQLANAKGQPHTSETLNEEIDGLMDEIEVLRAAYEQYFLGIERKPPTQRHDKLKKRVNLIQTSTVKQTAVKFKAQSLNAKLITYERLWTRTLNEMEQGTYRRDVFKAKLHSKEREDVKPPPPPPEALKGPAKPAAPPAVAAAAKPGVTAGAPAAAARPAPVAAQAGQISDSKMKAIYDAYVTAKKRCNEDTSKLSYDAVAHTLRQQVPALMKQHNAKSVEFKVVIKDGKAVLRAL